MSREPLPSARFPGQNESTPPPLSGPQDFTGAQIDASGSLAATPQIDTAKAAALFAELLSRQNLLLGIVGGAIAAILGAVLWAVITVAIKFQIGYMAIGVGFLVGIAVRYLGKGLTTKFGIVGAVFALLGCLLGNLWAVCGMVALNNGQPIVQMTLSVLMQPTVAMELLVATFSPMDLLFYGIAVYEGYHLSFRQVTDQELAELTSSNS